MDEKYMWSSTLNYIHLVTTDQVNINNN